MIKAVIFDMDGLMVESEPLHFKAYKEAIKNLGVILNWKDYLPYLGVSDKDISKSLIKRFKLSISEERLINNKREIYLNYLKKEIEPKKELLSLVKQLFNEGLLLAVASSSTFEEIETILSKFRIIKYFREIISAEDAIKGKPSPDIFLLTAAKLKVEPNDCLVLEDSKNGVIAAKKAGMKCFMIPSTKLTKHESIEADKILESLGDVYSQLK